MTPETRMTDEALRVFVYDTLVATGTAPSSAEIGAHFSVDAGDARVRIGSMRIGKTIVVHPKTGELWMAGPFAASRSGYTLTDGTQTWWANCAWDMFGVANIVGRSLLATAVCSDCGEPLTVECDPARPPAPSERVVHFLLPASRWYDDIGFT